MQGNKCCGRSAIFFLPLLDCVLLSLKKKEKIGVKCEVDVIIIIIVKVLTVRHHMTGETLSPPGGMLLNYIVKKSSFPKYHLHIPDSTYSTHIFYTMTFNDVIKLRWS